MMLFARALEGDSWAPVVRCDPRARALADRHYSRQTPGALDFTAPGRKLVMLTDDERAVWAVVDNLDPCGAQHWRVTMFRNEGAQLSSDLIREATGRTRDYWRRHYKGEPPVPLTTEIDPGCVRRKRDPGRCFLRAGWKYARTHRGLVVLEAPR